MTDREIDWRKSEQRSWFYSQLHAISDYYPTVESLTISYHQIYRSAFETTDKRNVLCYDATSRDGFLIECLNGECTCIGYNLKNIIFEVVARRELNIKGKLCCEGGEVPGHLYQSCGAILYYDIAINYK